MENTYIKNYNENFNPNTIQIIDGGTDKNKGSIIIVKILAG